MPDLTCSTACHPDGEDSELDGQRPVEEEPASKSRGAHAEAHLPFWEPGCGHYGDTLGQNGRSVVDDCQELLLSFVDAIPLENAGGFTVADFGTNDGYASMSLIENIIRCVKKKRGDTFPVQVVYEDQERNDFNSLFNRLTATNIGFYQQCVPDSSCDIIFTSMTTHWLQSLDGTFKDCVFSSSLKDDDADLKRVYEAAERDWNTFLLHRARELKPGGLLVVLSLSAFNSYRSADQEKTTPDKNIEGLGAVYRQGVGGIDVRRDLETAWRKLREENVITQEEFHRCMAPTSIRTAREITTPFETVASPVRDAGLSLVHHDQIVYPFYAKLLWREKKRQASPSVDNSTDDDTSPVVEPARDGIDDRQFFARTMTSARRTWSETTFRSSLSGMRTAEEKRAILDRMYASFEAGLLDVDPEDYNTDYIISRLVARKC